METSHKISYAILGLIIAASFGLMISVSRQESPIMDELAHIPAGYGYDKFFDYRLNPEHPPLVKMISALPLTFLNLTFHTQSANWVTYVNGQWDAGTEFLYRSGNDADRIVQWARIGPMLLTLLLIFFIYLWASELLGAWWGLLPAALFGLSPTVLAHGHFVTTDIGAALGFFVSLYYFTKFQENQTKKNLILAGVGFGVAQLLKFSGIILIPYLLLLTFIFYGGGIWRNWEYGATGYQLLRRAWFDGWKRLRDILLIFLIGAAVIYPLYFVTTIGYPPEKQHADTAEILKSFATGPTTAGQICKPARCLADLDIWASDKPLVRPYAEYLLGVLMVIQRASGGNTGYFLGHVSAEGSGSYFPLVYLMKESLPALILTGLALLLSVWGVMKTLWKRKSGFADYLETHPGEFAMILLIIIYMAYSINGRLNIGVRHLLPIFPAVYILTASGLKRWFNNANYQKAKFALLGVMVVWLGAEVGTAYPYYLSYFNEASGGTNGGWQYVTDSNYDWGQDLKRLGTFVKENNIDKIAVKYFGAGDLTYYVGPEAVQWESRNGDPREQGIHWFAVSVNELQNSTKPWLDSLDPRNDEDRYLWLQNILDINTLYARAGTSIFIYKLP
ncbi:MAG TPA: glycosyltransferase family 39 protein [Candidatus Paceibacterota bacterium]|nr:glycosyltransferase family 39 protein [Candidatus Paceibacterota bacterium]